MPDFYQPGDYDMCGTIAGIVDKSKIITGKNIKKGDVLIGVGSNGLHTNGYTLARHVLLKRFSVDDKIDELDETLADELLKIHLNYHPLISRIIAQIPVNGISHVTGGGIVKNTQRLLPKGLSLQIDWESWPVPPIFNFIQKAGNVPIEDMRQTFNMGVGLIFVVDAQHQNEILEFGQQSTFKFYLMGNIE